MGKYFTPEEIKQQQDYIREHVHDKTNFFTREGIVQDIIKRFVPMTGTIVEAGVGGGKLSKDLLAAGYHSLHLLDIDNYLPQELRQPPVVFHQMDLSFASLPFESNSVDAVLAIAIVEHLENPILLAREAARVLKPGGIYVIAIPWIFSLRSRFSFLFRGDLKGYNLGNNHIALFTKAVFAKVFLKYFSIAETRYGGSYIRILGRKWKLPGERPWLDRLIADKVLYVFQKK